MLADIPKKQKIFVMIGMLLAMFLSALDQTIVATAMPKIVQELNGLEHLSWVFTSYMLASTIIVPIYGKLSDIYGRKYFVLSAIVIFLIGSILSGLAQNMFQLILFRAIQGAGAGAIFANAFATIGDLFVPSERGRWTGLFGAVFGLSSVIGPTLGGWLTDNASWRWNFFINVPIGILALLVVGFLMPKITPAVKNKSIDYLGAALLSSALLTLLLGLVWGGNQYAWDSLQILTLFGVSVIAFGVFAFWEKVAEEPILPLDLFKNRIFTVSILVTFLTGIGMFGSIIYVPLFAQLVLGVSATNSGNILTPMMLGIVGASIASGQIMSRTNKYKWLGVGGLGLAAAAIYWLSQLTSTSTQEELITRMILIGIGMGISFPIYTLAVQNAVPHAKLGIATASTQLARSLGATVGTAVLGTVLNNSLTSKFGDLKADKFVQMASKINPQFDFSLIDANKLQGLLTGPVRTMIEAKLRELPPEIQAQGLIAFTDFISKTKVVFASSITAVFQISAVVMILAFLTAFFLKEVPLRKTHHEAPAEH